MKNQYGHKLTFAQAEVIRASRETNGVLATRYKVSTATISHIKRGLTHRCQILINLTSAEMQVLQLMAGERCLAPDDMARRFVVQGLQDYPE